MVLNSKPTTAGSVSISSSLFIGYGIALPYFMFVTYGLAKHLEISKTALAFGLLTKIATGTLILISIGILFTELRRKKDKDDKFGLYCASASCLISVLLFTYSIFATHALSAGMEVGKAPLILGIVSSVVSLLGTLLCGAISFVCYQDYKNEHNDCGLYCITLETFGSDCQHQHAS